MPIIQTRPRAPLPQLVSFVVFGAFFAGMGLMAVDRRLSSWQDTDDLVQVDAELLSTSCTYQKRIGRNGRDRWLFEPQYVYRFAGREWVGQRYSRLAEQSAFGFPEDCEVRAAEFRKHRQLRVWVSPSKPSYSVIDPTKPSFSAFEAVAISAGVLLWIWGGLTYRAATRPKPTVSGAPRKAVEESAALQQWMRQEAPNVRWRWLQTVTHRIVTDEFQLHLIQISGSGEFRVYVERDQRILGSIALQPGDGKVAPDSDHGRRLQEELLASAVSEIAADHQGVYWRNGAG